MIRLGILHVSAVLALTLMLATPQTALAAGEKTRVEEYREAVMKIKASTDPQEIARLQIFCKFILRELDSWAESRHPRYVDEVRAFIAYRANPGSFWEKAADAPEPHSSPLPENGIYKASETTAWLSLHFDGALQGGFSDPELAYQYLSAKVRAEGSLSEGLLVFVEEANHIMGAADKPAAERVDLYLALIQRLLMDRVITVENAVSLRAYFDAQRPGGKPANQPSPLPSVVPSEKSRPDPRPEIFMGIESLEGVMARMRTLFASIAGRAELSSSESAELSLHYLRLNEAAKRELASFYSSAARGRIDRDMQLLVMRRILDFETEVNGGKPSGLATQWEAMTFAYYLVHSPGEDLPDELKRKLIEVALMGREWNVFTLTSVAPFFRGKICGVTNDPENLRCIKALLKKLRALGSMPEDKFNELNGRANDALLKAGVTPEEIAALDADLARPAGAGAGGGGDGGGGVQIPTQLEILTAQVGELTARVGRLETRSTYLAQVLAQKRTRLGEQQQAADQAIARAEKERQAGLESIARMDNLRTIFLDWYTWPFRDTQALYDADRRCVEGEYWPVVRAATASTRAIKSELYALERDIRANSSELNESRQTLEATQRRMEQEAARAATVR